MDAFEDRALTEDEAAEFLGMCKGTLRTARSLGKRPNRIESPPYFKIGPRCVRYSLKDLHEYRERFRVTDGGHAT
tara:strand:- start:106 stop:330 length:225 start_codon:yes stop_codon:yes gene_type:complete